MEQERPLKERIWEFTKDLSVKVSRKAEKHWKINTLRVEIASIRHRINVKYKELGRTVFDAFKEGVVEDEATVAHRDEIIEELAGLEADIELRLARIETLEEEDLDEEPEDRDVPPPAPIAETPPESPPEEEEATPVATEKADAGKDDDAPADDPESAVNGEPEDDASRDEEPTAEDSKDKDKS